MTLWHPLTLKSIARKTLWHPLTFKSLALNMAAKTDTRRRIRESLIISVTVSAIVLTSLHVFQPVTPQPTTQSIQAIHYVTSSPNKRLIFYNRPPKTGSTSVRIAMKNALEERRLVSAKCFNRIEWNEMALRSIVNRRSVDFYGCHTRVSHDRFRDIMSLRAGNVTFMTSTRPSDDIILSAYLQLHRGRDVAKITDPEEVAKEIEKYKEFLTTYPVNALYTYHGADYPLDKCPYEWKHVDAMRRIAERYEIVVDLERPQESAALVEIVTGLKPDFTLKYNERTKESSSMIDKLMAIDTSSRSCGNQLVHQVLSQQFNIIKDRLMQNRCFDEDSGTFELCDKVGLTVDGVVEKNREESFAERNRLQSQ